MNPPASGGAAALRSKSVANDAWIRDERILNPMSTRSSVRLADRWMIRLPLAGVTFVSKIGAPGLAALGISFAIPFIYLGAALGVISKRLVIDVGRLIAFLMMGATLWLMQLVQGSPFSTASLLMLCALHFPCVLGGRARIGGFERAWAAFRLLVTILACCGIAQYLLQFVIGSKLAFPMDNLVPDVMRVVGFNGQGWLSYGSTTYRANGVFMLEASFFSQILAIAIVGEFVQKRPGWARLALFAVATLVSYSGTGMMSIVVCFPVWVIRRRRWDIAVVAIAGLALLWALVISGLAEGTPLALMASRVTEFSSTRSSGFARFVGGFFLFEQYLWPDPWRTLFGFGAGSFLNYSYQAQFAAHGMALFKMVFEFGIVGAAAYFSFVAYCFATSQAPVELCVAIFVAMMIQNYIPFAHGMAFALLMWSSPSRAFFSRNRA